MPGSACCPACCGSYRDLRSARQAEGRRCRAPRTADLPSAAVPRSRTSSPGESGRNGSPSIRLPLFRALPLPARSAGGVLMVKIVASEMAGKGPGAGSRSGSELRVRLAQPGTDAIGARAIRLGAGAGARREERRREDGDDCNDEGRSDSLTHDLPLFRRCRQSPSCEPGKAAAAPITRTCQRSPLKAENAAATYRFPAARSTSDPPSMAHIRVIFFTEC